MKSTYEYGCNRAGNARSGRFGVDRARQRHGRQVQMERVMASLRMAVRRENGVETLPAKRPLLRAS